MISHATPTPTQMALHEARKARQAHQARMASRLKANDNRKPRPAMAKIETQAPDEPEAPKERLPDNYHVTMYRVWLVMIGAEIDAIEAAKALCAFNGTTLEEVQSSRRRGRFIVVKKAIIRSVYDRFNPRISTTRIGNIFRCNHETVLYHVGRTKRGKAMNMKGYAAR